MIEPIINVVTIFLFLIGFTNYDTILMLDCGLGPDLAGAPDFVR